MTSASVLFKVAPGDWMNVRVLQSEVAVLKAISVRRCGKDGVGKSGRARSTSYAKVQKKVCKK